MADQQPEQLLAGVPGGARDRDARDRARRVGGPSCGARVRNRMHQEAYLYIKNAIGSMKIR